MLKIYPVVVGPIETNCYLVTNAQQETLLIDPGAEAEIIKEAVLREGLRPKAILITHGHYDHLLAAPELAKHYSIEIWFPEQDQYLFSAQKAAGVLPQDFALPERTSYYTDKLAIPGFSITVIPTPGHTLGQTCFLIEEKLFSGDMLFSGGYLGRTDLWGGSAQEIQVSLKKLLELPDKINIFPGHGPAGTIGAERGYYE